MSNRPHKNSEVSLEELVEARRRYPTLASSVAGAIEQIEMGKTRNRGARSFLIDAFGWQEPTALARLDRWEAIIASYLDQGVGGAAKKLLQIGAADRSSWVSLVGELDVADAVTRSTGAQLLAFDPPNGDGQRADLLVKAGEQEVLVEVHCPREEDANDYLSYPMRLMEALKYVEAGVSLSMHGADKLSEDSELPDIAVVVKKYRERIGAARIGDVIDLFGPLQVEVVETWPEPSAVRVAGSLPSRVVGDPQRLADAARREARQLSHTQPGLVIIDLGAQSTIEVDEWDPTLRAAARILASNPPSRGDAVLCTRGRPSGDTGGAPFITIWEHSEPANQLLSLLHRAPVRPEMVTDIAT